MCWMVGLNFSTHSYSVFLFSAFKLLETKWHSKAETKWHSKAETKWHSKALYNVYDVDVMIET